MTRTASDQYDVKPFDIAEHLDNEAVIAEYLTSILAEGDQDELLEAISQVARARGMTDLARGGPRP